MSALDRAPVRRVQDALEAAGSAARVIELADSARSAGEAAAALGCDVGRIVKSLVFMVADRPVLALVAGDMRCCEAELGDVLGIDGEVRRADADAVKETTGFSIGAVAPLAHATPLPVAVDASLWRFDEIYAAAGHPRCVFPESPDALVAITKAVVSARVAAAG